MTAPHGGGWFPGGGGGGGGGAAAAGAGAPYSGGYNTGNTSSYPSTPVSGGAGGGGSGASGVRPTWAGSSGSSGQPMNGYSNFEITIPTVNRWTSHPGAPPGAAIPGIPTQSNTGEPHLLLISLAESYFEAAHANGYRAAVSKGADARAYYKLIATGLRCLEAALQCRLQPRMEAMVRLRYAGILHEETENGDEAEGALNKGVCETQPICGILGRTDSCVQWIDNAGSKGTVPLPQSSNHRTH